jgi:hypothetical protein
VDEQRSTLREAAEAAGLEPALVERVCTSLGFPQRALEQPTHEDVEALRYVASVLAAGFPLVAFLELTRVYPAGAIRDRRCRGAPLSRLGARAADPGRRAGPPDWQLRWRTSPDLPVGIAFCDLAGYTRFIEEEALSLVASFIEALTGRLPKAPGS